MRGLKRKNGGFLGILAVFVILILLVSAFKINLRGYIDSKPEQALDNNVILIIETGKIIWIDYKKSILHIAMNPRLFLQCRLMPVSN